MKLAIVAGSPSAGKSSVISAVIKKLRQSNWKPAVCKMDCISSNDEKLYQDLQVPVVTGLSQNMCPDHFLAINYEGMMDWAKTVGANLLIIETAGLCNRCAPFLGLSTNFCVIDSTANIKSPEKLGPMVTTADIIVYTKNDMISQIERAILDSYVSKINNRAKRFSVNGVTGSGAQALMNIFNQMDDLDNITEDTLVYDMPNAICSYCVGERRVGKEYHQGIIEYMKTTNYEGFSYE